MTIAALIQGVLLQDLRLAANRFGSGGLLPAVAAQALEAGNGCCDGV